ncbi:response regulator transcription factor [Cellulomonas sp. ES6]|uniref:response regulator n=1 Tax=Cellulomonas sp. ES6 TaxID=3039384 RepID=UPI0024B752A6|nr:response regulator transcription factor [Cellulomonas sp. ES6]WHP17871.1 response regulator transcription factor [Cellulomonas sp. ES6]
MVTRVLLVDDQAMMRTGLRAILDGSDGIVVVGEATDGADAVRQAVDLRPDVVLMDLQMPGLHGVEATRRLRRDSRLRDTRVLVLTTFDGDAETVAALRAGASGFLGKSAGPDELVEAVLAVAGGRAALSAHALSVVVEDASGRQARDTQDEDLARRIATLTARERDVVAAAAQGADNRQIAAQLFISPFTVKTHLNRAMTKLGARDRAQVVVLAHRAGMA